MDNNERKREFGKWNYSVALDSPDKDQAARGALILHRLVPAPDHGAGWKRDPETGFVYYSSEWLDDESEAVAVARSLNRRRQNGELISEQDVETALRDAKAPE